MPTGDVQRSDGALAEGRRRAPTTLPAYPEAVHAATSVLSVFTPFAWCDRFKPARGATSISSPSGGPTILLNQEPLPPLMLAAVRSGPGMITFGSLTVASAA